MCLRGTFILLANATKFKAHPETSSFRCLCRELAKKEQEITAVRKKHNALLRASEKYDNVLWLYNIYIQGFCVYMYIAPNKLETVLSGDC